MPSFQRFAVTAFAAAAALAAARPCAPQPAPAPAVAIRAAVAADLAAAEVDAALASVDEILGRSGIVARWRVCASFTPPGACAVPLAERELIVRVLNAAPGSHASSLGFSWIDPTAAVNQMATVFADRVAELAGRTGIPPTLLLGRAMAHEIGHLLLGSTGHGVQGLMRARWTDRDLRSPAPADFLFTDAEARRLRDRLRRAPAPREERRAGG